MIYGIGIDIIRISRIKKAIERWNERFLKKVFTENEILFCKERPKSTAAFALRFAAKEAFSKAIGLGMKKGIRWRDIEVFHFPTGKPALRLYGKAYEICKKNGLRPHLTLSDEGDIAVAVVVLEKDGA